MSALEAPVTRTGYCLEIRRATPADLPRLQQFFARVSPEDLRHRFLSSVRTVGRDRLDEMVRGDDPHLINLLAIEQKSGEIVATATLVADEDGESAEFALCTRADRKRLGVSWTILEHLVALARAAGIKRLQSVETADDTKAMELEREMGFRTRLHPEDASLMIAEQQLGPA